MAFVPGHIQKRNTHIAPFDFDNALFQSLWNPNRPNPFLTYTRYYISDHRPLWAEFQSRHDYQAQIFSNEASRA